MLHTTPAQIGQTVLIPPLRKRTKQIIAVAYVVSLDPHARGVTFVHSDGAYKTFQISRRRSKTLARVLQVYPINNLGVSCNIVPHFDGWSVHINRGV